MWIHRKTTTMEFCFSKVGDHELNFCGIFQSNCFIMHMWSSASAVGTTQKNNAVKLLAWHLHLVPIMLNTLLQFAKDERKVETSSWVFHLLINPLYYSFEKKVFLLIEAPLKPFVKKIHLKVLQNSQENIVVGDSP